jgi:hypothetical protein
MADKIDLEAIFKEINIVASISATEISGTGTFVQNGRLIPEGAKNDPSLMTWPGNAGKGPLGKWFNYRSHASDDGNASEVNIGLLCTWDAGGQVSAQGGATYIENLHLYVAVPGGLGVTEGLDCTASLANALMVDGDYGRTAQLEADVGYVYKQFHFMQIDKVDMKFTIRGDGYGRAVQIG